MAYAPAGMKTDNAGLLHMAGFKYYNRTALDRLMTKFMFWKGVDDKVLPRKNGKTIQFYRWSLLGANTSQTSEGTVGTSLEMAPSSTVSATVGQYSDFISFSDMLVDTDIDPDIVAEGAEQLGYRAGISCDNMIRAELDSVASSVDLAPLGDYFSAADLANASTRFAALNIKRHKENYFTVLAHPYSTYDFKLDPQVGGFRDVIKQAPGVQGHSTLFTTEDRGFVARFNDCAIYETTNTTMTSGSPNTYRSYIFGEGGVAAIDLAGRGPSRVMDPENSRFKIHVSRNEQPTVANPEGKIAAFCSYKFAWVVKIMDTNPYRFRKWDHANSLGL